MKKIYIIAITALISSVITAIFFWTTNTKNLANNDNLKVGIVSVKEVEYEIPSLSLTIRGKKTASVLSSDLQGLKKYKITAVTSDNIYKHKNTYIGVKLKDFLSATKIDYYNSLTFMSTTGLQVKYVEDLVTDDVYLVFEKDGRKYPKVEPVALLNPILYDRYNLTGILSIRVD